MIDATPPSTPPQFLLASDHISKIAGYYGVTGHDILGPSRFQRIVEARHHCYWHFRQAGRSYPSIGRIMNRDHSTVIHGIAQHVRRNKIVERLPAGVGYSEGLL